MTRTAISPRLAMSIFLKHARLPYIRKMPNLGSLIGALSAADRGQAQDIASPGQVDDTVVPQLGGVVIRAALLVEHLQDGLADEVYLLRSQGRLAFAAPAGLR